MSEVNQFVRFDATPPQKAPPPADAIDLAWESESESLKVVKPDGTTSTIGGDHSITVSGTISPDINVTLYPVGEINGKTAWSSTGEPFSYPVSSGSGVFLYSESDAHYALTSVTDGSQTALWISGNYPSRPDAAIGWAPDGVETGTPVLTYT